MLPGMTEKPSYLGLLNAISNAEAEAECYLTAWAAVTPRDDVRSVLSTVALREGEHAKAFAKRMCELGFEVQPRSDARAADRMAIASSTELSDLEKFERLELGLTPVDGQPDIFAGMFGDPSIDIQTGGLLGRYIAEERDSGRMFQACRQALAADANGHPGTNGHAGTNGSAAVNGSAASGTEQLARIEHLLQRLVDKLSV